MKVVMELEAQAPGGEPFVCAEGEALYEKVGGGAVHVVRDAKAAESHATPFDATRSCLAFFSIESKPESIESIAFENTKSFRLVRPSRHVRRTSHEKTSRENVARSS